MFYDKLFQCEPLRQQDVRPNTHVVLRNIETGEIGWADLIGIRVIVDPQPTHEVVERFDCLNAATIFGSKLSGKPCFYQGIWPE